MTFPYYLNIMEKKNIQNKAEKPKTTTKAAPKKKEVSLSELPEIVVIVGKESKHLKEGVEYTVNKAKAKILIDKGVAELKK